MSRGLHWLALAALLWLAMLVGGLALRPLLPVDETRYLAVAWEMWHRGDFLVPFRNGEAYSHKPPLLFWLIQLGWAAFGVNETWARLVAPLFALGAIVLTFALARRLWPDRPQTRGWAAALLPSTALFAVFSTLTLFDSMVAFFALAGWLGVAIARDGEARRGWVTVALAIGFGVLAKGPVILVHVLPAALLAPWWAGEARPASWRRWYGGLGLAVLGGAAIGLAWAIPAAVAGGPEFARAIFIGQSAGRMVESFAHKRPFWWYVPVFLGLLGPVLWWGAPWRLARATPGLWREPGLRFCVAVAAPVFVFFSLVSGKQVHYLLPELALFAIAVARLLDQDAFADRALDRLLPGLALTAAGFAIALSPVLVDRLIAGRPGVASPSPFPGFALGVALMLAGAWVLGGRTRGASARVASFAVGVAAVTIAGHAAFAPLAPAYDPARPARSLRDLERLGFPIAIAGDYESEFHFAARLTRPIAELHRADPVAWATANPKGAVIATYSNRPRFPDPWPTPIYAGAWRGRVLAIWPSEALLAIGPELLSDLPRGARQ